MSTTFSNFKEKSANQEINTMHTRATDIGLLGSKLLELEKIIKHNLEEAIADNEGYFIEEDMEVQLFLEECKDLAEKAQVTFELKQ